MPSACLCSRQKGIFSVVAVDIFVEAVDVEKELMYGIPSSWPMVIQAASLIQSFKQFSLCFIIKQSICICLVVKNVEGGDLACGDMSMVVIAE